MDRFLRILTLLLSAIAIAWVISRAEAFSVEENERQIIIGELIPVPMPTPDPIILICSEECTDVEVARLKMLESKINQTLMSKCFEDYILSPFRDYNYLLGQTPADIIRIMNQSQIISVRYYYDRTASILGFQIGDEPEININRHGLARYAYSFCDEASLMAHEISHVKGFKHRGNSNNSYNRKTPPYVINAAFDSKLEDPSNGGCCI